MKTSTVQRKHVIQPKQKYNHLYFAVILLIIVSVIIAICVLTFNSIKQEMENNSSKDYEMMQVDDQQNKPKGAEIGSNTGEDTRLVKSNSDNSTKPNRHVCYLTFDDGPSANTERILSILDKYNIKATWFIKADNQDLSKVKKIWDEGNQVAVHTFTHDYNQIYASTNAFWNDYNLAYTALEQTLGFKPANMLRFPGGSSNSYNANISKTLINQCSQNNIHFFDWNQSCGDGANHTSDELVFYATDGAEKLNSVCLLMHDSYAKDTTVDALERIINFYKDHGYSFEYLNEESYNYIL